MSLSILATGALIRQPERRTSAKGTDYCTALLRVPSADAEPMLVSVICFDAEAALLAHSKGDDVAVAGRAALKTWTGKDGTEQHCGRFRAHCACLRDRGSRLVCSHISK